VTPAAEPAEPTEPTTPAHARTLFVLRHAKSSWDDPGLGDHERPLAPRGRRAALQIAAHLRAHEIAPALVLCSPARRTVQTLEAVAPGGKTLIEPELYAASASALLARLRQVPNVTTSVMLIGHNPGLQMLVLALAGDRTPTREDPTRAAVANKFPTAALATLSLDGGWSDLQAGGAELTGYVRPKDLPA
jgi:phosphohistidine phosphatase